MNSPRSPIKRENAQHDDEIGGTHLETVRDERLGAKCSGMWRRIQSHALLQSPRGLLSVIVVGLMVIIALLAPVVAPFGPDQQFSSAFLGGSSSHLLGTDEYGRDILSRTIYAIRVDLVLAFVAIPAGALIGILLGLSGIWSKHVGQVAARVFDVIIGFPTLIFGLAVTLMLRPGLTAVAIAIAVVNVPMFGRLARAGMLAQLDRDYVLAARSLGATSTRILLRHVLPNVRGTLLVQVAISVADAVFIEGGLSILGLGIQPPTASLGSLVQAGLPYITSSPLYVLGPTVVLAVVILGFGLMADVLNGRSRDV